MNVLVVGSGGREHALAWKLRQSPRTDKLLIAPGNPGTATLGQNVAVAADDVGGLVAVAQEARVDLVVIGPEAALEAGLADALATVGIRCFGPTKAAARIESSKVWSKQLMQRVGIPTARFRSFGDGAAAHAFLRSEPWEQWRVIKLDGLAAGKGVVVAQSAEELHAAIDSFGSTGMPLILEEPLSGEELSLLALCDGVKAVPLLPAQDHKRLLDGDQGPNTGGMGAYAPLPQVDETLVGSLQGRIFEPVLRALAAEGTPLVGVLYAGLMLTPTGVQVLEFNARFGDPETQALLPLLDGDLLEIMLACVEGRLQADMVRWYAGAALGVVLAAAGYPEAPRKGDRIDLPAAVGDGLIFQGGTALAGEGLVTAGGRVLTVVGQAPTLAEAAERAYALAQQVAFAGKQMRSDIGQRGLTVEHH
ncbi:MAG: phosphoribosylamine--glycine ligase [Herpetosiphonaceae bacterium]|nr:phosphoribosylamine--glycine ligase [Herpetosiphonaceae bacterium]